MDAATLQAIADLGAARFAKLSCDERPASSQTRQAQQSDGSGAPTRVARNSAWNDVTKIGSDPRIAHLADNDDYMGQTHRLRLENDIRHTRRDLLPGLDRFPTGDRGMIGPGPLRRTQPARLNRAAVPGPRNIRRAPSPRAAGTVKFVKGRRVDGVALDNVFKHLLASAPTSIPATSSLITNHASLKPQLNSRNRAIARGEPSESRFVQSNETSSRAAAERSQVQQTRKAITNAPTSSESLPTSTKSIPLGAKHSALQPPTIPSAGLSKNHKVDEMPLASGHQNSFQESLSRQHPEKFMHVSKVVELVDRAKYSEDKQALHEYIGQNPASQELVTMVEVAFTRIAKTEKFIWQILVGTLDPLERYIYTKVEEHVEALSVAKTKAKATAVSLDRSTAKRKPSAAHREASKPSRAVIAPLTQSTKGASDAESNADSAQDSVVSVRQENGSASTPSPHGSRWSNSYINNFESDGPGKVHVTFHDTYSGTIRELRCSHEIPCEMDVTIKTLKVGIDPHDVAQLMKTLIEDLVLLVGAQEEHAAVAKQDGHIHKGSEMVSFSQGIAERSMPGSYIESSDDEDFGDISDREWDTQDADEFVQDAY